jgi:uncharacterized protein YjcR
MEEELDERFDEAIVTINSLNNLFDKIESAKKREIMKTMLLKSLEKVIFKTEETYYKKIIQKKSMSVLENKHDIEIKNSYCAIDAFLSFAIAFSLYNDV